ncbi:MAG: fibronectin type III domain-containing protein, partial [Oscillospiraceae bacterium]|nr:fibronectin type III domain-containing protein [Oscillospiraceae bacterium]
VGVVLPEIPEPADPFAFATEDSIEVADLNTPFDPVMEDKESRSRKKKKNSTKKFLSQERKKKIKRFFVTMLFLAVFAGFALLGFWYYQNVYLQTIDSIEIDGGRNQVTVTINTRADDSLLIVSCFDNYGNSSEASVTNGQAVFSNLLPNTMYTVAVSIDGFHDLVGHTSEVFTTDTTTRILSFTAVTGTEDGSAIISFTVDGDEPEEWVVSYYAEGEDPKTQEFSGHSATITGLTLGKLYNFTLDAGSSLSLSGTTTMTFVPTRLILAENLTVSTSSGSDLVIHWNSPGDTVVESWNVRVYDDADYEYSETVTETEVHLSNINPEKSYTVEVTASGMTQPARASITANPIIITNLEVDDSASDQLTVRWDYSGAEPEGGWLLMYSIDGNVNINVIKCNQAAAVIAPKLPEAKYEFTVQAVDGTSIFDNTHLYTCPAAPGYNANGVTQEQITAYLLKTPSDPNWTYDRVGNKGFTDQFKLGDPISIVLYGSTDFYLPGTEMKVLYVIRDSHGNVIPDYVTEATEYWRQIWYSGNYHYGELDLPITPEVTGTYQLNIYFDGAAIAEVTFTVS